MGREGKKGTKSTCVYSWSSDHETVVMHNFFCIWSVRGLHRLELVHVTSFPVFRDRGPVAYILLAGQSEEKFLTCEELGGLVGIGVKEECPDMHFIMTPGDTMSISYT